MPEFYYKMSNRDSAYRIDEVSQQILVYLFSKEMSNLRELTKKVDVDSEPEIQERITEQLGPDAAGLITQSELAQTTLNEDESPIPYGLTDEGKQFVESNKGRLSMPADFKELARSIRELHTDVIEIRDSLHRIDADELNEELSMLAQRLESIQSHISNYD